jgi:hypothetical protein
MKKSVKFLSVLIATLSVVSLMSPMSASATTKEDVIAVAREVGMPESLVQSYISLGANREVTSEQCDKAIAKLYEIYGTTNDKISNDFGVDITDEPTTNTTVTTVTTQQPQTTTADDTKVEVTTQPQDSQGNANVVTSSSQGEQVDVTTQVQGQGSVEVSTENDVATPSDYQAPIAEEEFISMTYDEKVEFVNSLPQEEKTLFMNNLTTAERNSIIKQMSLDDKADIVNSIVEAGKSMGYNFSVDELSGSNISLSMRDDEGTLIGVTKFGTSVDDTGKDYTALVLSMLALAGVSGYALFKISKKVG